MADNDDFERAVAMSDSPEEGSKFLDINNAFGSSPKTKFLTYLFLSIAFLAVFVVLLVLCLGFRADYRTLQTAHNERMEIINYAEVHNINNLQGVVTGSTIDEDTGRYAFTYRVMTAGGDILEGASPAIYTQEEINSKYANNMDVQIAVKDMPFVASTQSVNMSYAEYNMMNYPPYKKAKVGFITMLVATSICFFIVCCFAGFAILACKQMRKNEVGEDEKVEVIKPNGTRKKVD